MESKVGERNMERICRREVHGNDMQERGTWKGYVGERNMERICKREEHEKQVGERNMERICKREEHGKEGW